MLQIYNTLIILNKKITSTYSLKWDQTGNVFRSYPLFQNKNFIINIFSQCRKQFLAKKSSTIV